MIKRGKVVADRDNPELTAADIARARPAKELPAHIRAAFPNMGKVGRPAGSDKTPVTIRMDNDTLERWRSTGPGWQTRLNEALRKVPAYS
jgi:uncharacterized protein (DUF4415 family)